MGRVYNRKWLNVEGKALLVPSSGSRTFQLGFPPECQITRLVVKQVAGTTPKAFKVDLFNASPAGGSITEAGSALPTAQITPAHQVAAAGGPDEAYTMIPQQSGTAGNAASLITELGYSYQSDKGSESRVGNNGDRNVYIKITVTSPAEDTLWDVYLTAEVEA